MSRSIITMILVGGSVAACGGTPSQETHYFAPHQELWRRIVDRCAPHDMDPWFQHDTSLPEEYSVVQGFRCRLRLPGGQITRLLPITLQGSGRTGKPRQACAIRIGPAPSNEPVPLDMVLAWFDDRAAAAALQAAVGSINYDDELEVQLTTAGFHLWWKQSTSSVDGLQIDLSIDGCNRMPDSLEYRWTYPRSELP